MAPGAQLTCGKFYRIDDLRIGATAAEIAGQVMPDLIVVRVRMRLEQLACHEHEPRRAEPALERAAFEKGLLNGSELSVGPEMLDRHHLGVVNERGEHEAA